MDRGTVKIDKLDWELLRQQLVEAKISLPKSWATTYPICVAARNNEAAAFMAVEIMKLWLKEEPHG